MPLRVQIVTPEREIEVADDATLVIAKGVEGDVGIMPGHSPLLIALGLGPMVLQREGRRDELFLDGGFLQVKDDNVIVLAEYAVIPRELDPSAIEQETEQLRARLQADAENETLKRQLARQEALRRLLQVG